MVAKTCSAASQQWAKSACLFHFPYSRRSKGGFGGSYLFGRQSQGTQMGGQERERAEKEANKGCYQAGYHCRQLPWSTYLRVSHPRREGAGVFVHPLPSVMFKGRCRRMSDLRNRGHAHWGAQNKRCQVFLSVGKRSALDYRRSLFCGNSAYTVCASGNPSCHMWKAMNIGRKDLFRTKLRKLPSWFRRSCWFWGDAHSQPVCTAAQ